MRKAYALARAELGTLEWAEGSNPKVDAYFDEVGFPTMQDDTAWCAAFVGAMLKRAGLPHTGKLTARSYLDWGRPVADEDAREGDLVIFWRGSPDGWQGHVGFFVRFEGAHVVVVGGNQRNQVSEARYPRDQVLGFRRMTRTSRAQSTTLQAAGGAAGTAVLGAIPVIGQLDATAQIVLAGTVSVVVLAAAWIARERLKLWAEGIR
ncbi:TIGR02594 family protein [Cognatishimia sp. F0-27]|uniref:TIGR02594 family protein n=1 Tax=Cognatishimia sp. F0-27 TaxID=2816855 RepID=UPI001D0C40C1|nr:TIGR02594 family protein [Cognatishimia sp. F0-27]MCC1492723.1 TIGR02594 family protein [Cognatishimia sp. F0-27]